ncbi:MAG TPA: helix-turn-helix domain-containing protein, partial [Acidimicrobiales bacterium]|nr:helix-turn-helix domain-containing protein [Acidimicrobiales bacterium]
MRPVSDIRRAQALIEAGWPLLTVAQELGVSRAALRDWRDRGFERVIAERLHRHAEYRWRDPAIDVGTGPPGSHPCIAPGLALADPDAYAYLLGQYLGDGTISRCRREVYKLRVFC